MTMAGATQDTAVLARKGSLWGTVKAVGAAFVGLRRRADLESDSQRLNPLHLVVIGFVAVAVFVGSLIGLVHWVVAR